MAEFPESIINSVVEALNRVVPNENGVMWIYETEDGERQPVTIYETAIDVLRALEQAMGVIEGNTYASQYRKLWVEESAKRNRVEQELAKMRIDNMLNRGSNG